MITFTDGAPISPYSLQPAQVVVASAVPLDPLWRTATEVGTGGYATPEYYLARRSFPGYIILLVSRTAVPQNAPLSRSVERMQTIRTAFGRNFSRLPAVFGVSRQTLYNWLNGEQPKSMHLTRIEALADAADIFLSCKYTPSSVDLGRSLLRGKSFLELMSSGADGRALAEKLMRLVCRGNAARERLDAILGSTPVPRLTPSDFGTPAFDETAD